MLYGLAEYDPPEFQRQTAALIAAHHGRHHAIPPLVWIPDHNHISEIVSLGLDDVLVAALLRFIERNIA